MNQKMNFKAEDVPVNLNLEMLETLRSNLSNRVRKEYELDGKDSFLPVIDRMAKELERELVVLRKLDEVTEVQVENVLRIILNR